jgi:hypothetical protein
MGTDDSYNSNFKYNRYDPVDEQLDNTFVDGSDALANQRQLFISFLHVPTQNNVFFKGFITAFNETFKSDWASETVYGRGDPIYQFKNTQRSVTLTFRVPAASDGEAYENLGKVQQLVQFLYPRYNKINSAQTITQSPLIRLKIMNLLRNVNDRFAAQDINYGTSPIKGFATTPTADKYENYKTAQTWESHDGLLGIIDNLTVNHGIEGAAEDGSFLVGQNTILSKMIEIQIGFNPIHEHALGWDEKGTFGASTNSKKKDQQRLFPYGVHLDNVASTEAELNNEAKTDSGNAVDEEGEPAAPDQTALDSAANAVQTGFITTTAEYGENIQTATGVFELTSTETEEEVVFKQTAEDIEYA